jgi:hypothetical protein
MAIAMAIAQLAPRRENRGSFAVTGRTSWLQHALKPTRWQPQRQMLALGTLGLFVAIIIGALYLNQSSTTSTLGRQLEELIAVRDSLQRQNEQLRAEIANLQRVGRLLQRAEELGFVPAAETDIQYIVVDGYNPDRVRAQAVITPQPDSQPLPQYDESFAGWVQQQFDALRAQIEGFSQQSVTGGAGDRTPVGTGN